MDLLHRKGVEIIIGVYASKRAYNSSFSEGISIRKASVEISTSFSLLSRPRQKMHVKNIKILMLCQDKIT